MRTVIAVTCSAAIAALAGCATTPADPDPIPPTTPAARATANLAPASASLTSGTLTLTTMGDGVHVGGEIGSLRPGAHGFHVHEFGDCSAADASSAGGHFNPTNTPRWAPGWPTTSPGRRSSCTPSRTTTPASRPATPGRASRAG